MKKLLFLVLLISNFFGYAQYTLIPDAKFEQALINDGIDTGPLDGKVQTASISGITSLKINSIGIIDLTGIQDFTSLLGLTCLSNQLTKLDISKNILLQSLDCDDNKLTSLDLSNNKDLEFISFGRNLLTNIDLSKQVSLTNLYSHSNPLKTLDVSNNTKLLLLNCDSNQLMNLDVSKNTLLRNLYCSNNLIPSLDVSKNTTLEYINCNINKLTSLDLSNNIRLTGISCVNNNLATLNLKNGNNINFFTINLTSNPDLTCIQVDNKAYSDTNWSSKKDATASFSENCSKTSLTIAPPVVTATGNQSYCPNTSIKIVTGVTITHDPSETGTNAIYIQISSGYVSVQDLLALANPLLHPTITTSWSSLEGKLKLYSPTGIPVTYSDFEAAIQDVTFTNSSISPSGTRDFSINLGFGSANYLPSNGHFYEYVPSLGINWTKARDEAAAKTYYGLQGYLATLTAADETQLAGAQAPGTGWIGGSDAATEGTWKWVTGPEAGTTFWIGKGNGATTPPFNYANWNTSGNEPNDSNNNEDYAHITAPALNRIGTWNDLRETGDPITNPNYYPQGYIVEYGGMPGDPVLQISASTTITIPKITSTTPSSNCGIGSLTLQATASDGIVNWYTSSTGGVSISTGNSYTTPIIYTTTSYYVDAASGNCPTVPRTEIIATINPIPTITSTTPASRCDTGTVTLGAVSSAGTINWYNAPTGGISLGTGTTFTTPSIGSTTTYYVEAAASGCTSPTRTAITATVNISPSITTTTSASRCDSGTVTIGAVASAGTINWYDVSTGGTALATGTAFTTPSIATTTTYYVDATASGCTTSTRTAIIATINPIPTITSTAPASRCDTGTVILGAVASAGTINWYDVSTGGTSLGTGTSFTTPSIASTTTYYVDATATGCTTPTRTAIIATVNISPSITSTTPASRCDAGTVTLGAISSGGTINWYDAPTAGTSLGSGASFTTPNITATTNYYVEATASGCTSPRLKVVATVYPILKTNEEVLLCQSETATLDASIPGMNYLWSPGGETTQTIVVSTIGDYTVTISSPFVASCDSKKNIKVIEHPKPVIKAIIVNENSMSVELENPQNYYEYSIDERFFQDSTQFSYIQSGQHTAFVREKNLCNLVQQDFTIFTIAKYFTPNNDGFNDVFEIKEMKNVPNSSALIFDRYGKLIITLNALKYSWDGKYNNNILPADDYWYRLKMEDSKPEIRGHFSLKR